VRSIEGRNNSIPNGFVKFKFKKMGSEMRSLKRWMGLISLSLLFAAPAHAAKFSVTGTVDEILVNRSMFGQCAISVAGWGAPGNCGKKWISLDCAGDFNNKSVARSMLELTQIAKATATDVTVFVDDRNLQNGRCVAYQTILR